MLFGNWHSRIVQFLSLCRLWLPMLCSLTRGNKRQNIQKKLELLPRLESEKERKGFWRLFQFLTNKRSPNYDIPRK